MKAGVFLDANVAYLNVRTMSISCTNDRNFTLKGKIVEFVGKGDFGLSSGSKSDGSYERVWFEELLSPDEVSFEANVFLLAKGKAKALKNQTKSEPVTEPEPKPDEKEPTITQPITEPKPEPAAQTVTLNLKRRLLAFEP